MKLKLQKQLLILSVSLILVNCSSVEKYNYKLSQTITVAKLQKDINYTQHKLEKLYPNLYGYITKEKLNFKFDSIRKVVTKPMTSKDFYFVISPVVASVRQGHMSMTQVSKRIPKKEAKRLKKAGDGPLSQFVYEYQNDKLYVIKNKPKKVKIKLGTEVVSVNGIVPSAVFKKYRNSVTSDGFNQTLFRKYLVKRYVGYMTNEIGINDSLTFVLKLKDSVFTKVISRNKIVKKAVVKDDIKVKKDKDSITKIAKNPLEKAKLKLEKKNKNLYGYDYTTKEYVKSFKVVSSDTTVGIVRIKNFSDGRFKEAYATIFDSIKLKNIQTLVIDIRGNPGGRVNDVVNLYSYLTDKEYTLLKPAEVTSKTSLWKLGMFAKLPKLAYPIGAVFYPIYMGFSYFRTTKNEDGSYQYKLVGSKPKPNNQNYFKGKIYVIIDGGCFSAACILASSLKSNPNVVFIGEETGGNFNGTVAGIMPVVKLPNSKIALRLGLMNIQTINQTETIGRGIFPDKEIVPTVDDKISNKDPELEWILSEVKKQKP
ncbi:S41 family peptidase [Flavobacterium sp.]|uniref:S41 family peptidase n=1 Tax=Flavobacterium sp. TaxID=239 RepID=UPI0037524C58